MILSYWCEYCNVNWGVWLLLKNLCDFSRPSTDSYKGFSCQASQRKAAVPTPGSVHGWGHFARHAGGVFAFQAPVPSFLGLSKTLGKSSLQTPPTEASLWEEEGHAWSQFSPLWLSSFPLLNFPPDLPTAPAPGSRNLLKPFVWGSLNSRMIHWPSTYIPFHGVKWT